MKRGTLQRGEVEETDADLVRRVGAGDLSPLGRLYDRHHEGVRQFVTRATAGTELRRALAPERDR